MMNIDAHSDAEIVVRTKDGIERSVELYSEKGVELLTALRMKQMAEFKTMYEPNLFGMRVIQVPNDLVAMQELVWRVRPGAIVELGIAHGGSLVMYAGLCELMGQGKVLGIDIEIRPENRSKVEAHEFSERIELLEQSSLDQGAYERASEFCKNTGENIIILDSNHSSRHVLQEMKMYSNLVSANGYLVVMDGAQALVSDIPRGKTKWKTDNPLTAIHKFLNDSEEFEIDPHFTRFGETSCPDGFLRRKTRAS